MLLSVRSGLVVVALTALIACRGSKATPDTNAGATAQAESAPCGTGGAELKPKAGVKAMGEAKVGDATRCPVSGDEFTVSAASPKSEFAGKTYFFCCIGCKAKFEADPNRFLKRS